MIKINFTHRQYNYVLLSPWNHCTHVQTPSLLDAWEATLVNSPIDLRLKVPCSQATCRIEDLSVSMLPKFVEAGSSGGYPRAPHFWNFSGPRSVFHASKTCGPNFLNPVFIFSKFCDAGSGLARINFSEKSLFSQFSFSGSAFGSSCIFARSWNNAAPSTGKAHSFAKLVRVMPPHVNCTLAMASTITNSEKLRLWFLFELESCDLEGSIFATLVSETLQPQTPRPSTL